ncbi:hypothetical protein BH20CHL8_BH20CHL8_02810 [soil metagenome]
MVLGPRTSRPLRLPTPNIRYDGGPRDGEADWLDRPTVTLGDGSDGGVYQRTDVSEADLVVYRWQELSDAEANAVIRGDLRSNQR